MSWSLKPRAAVVLPLLTLVAFSVLTVSVLYSQTPSVTVVSVGTEPRGLAINLTTSRAVVTNHNTNTVTVANLTNFSTSTVTVGSHPWGVAINTSTNRAYVVNEKSDSVSVLNLANNTLIATIPVGGNPKEIAINSTVAVVANSKTDNVSIIDLASNAVTKTLAVGVDPEGVVINTSNNRAFVTNRGSDTVSVIDLATKTVTATLNVGSAPSGIGIQTSSQRIVLANHLSDSVTILNGSNNSAVATVTVGSGPTDVAINTGANRAYVTNTYSDSVSVIDLSTNQVIATYLVGRDPEGIAVVPSYNLLLVVNTKGDTVYAINLTNPPTGTIAPVGKDPEGIAIDPDANSAVTANSKSNDLSVIDLSTGTFLATLPAGKNPRDVAIHPTTKKLVSANHRANTASIYDLPTRTLLATVTVGKGPNAVAIDPGLNLAAVANERGDTLSLIDLSTHAVSATIAAGSHPKDIDINPSTHLAVVANKKKDVVTLIDLVSRTTVATIPVGKDPVSVAVNPQTNMAAVVNEKANTVSIINLATKTVTATINVLATPTGVAINPSTNVAAVVSHEAKKLQTIDLSTNTVLTDYPAGWEPEQVAINPYTNVAAVTNEDPGAVAIIQLNNPAPVLGSLSPASATAGGMGFTLTLNGSRFLKSSTMNFGALIFTPQFISNSQLKVDLPASAMAQAGAVQASVTNPAPGGGTSNSLSFAINNPVPSIGAISPQAVIAGSAAFTLTVGGTNFVGASSIFFNGQPLATTFVGATQLTALVPASAIGTAGSFPVTVTTPAPGGGTSNTATFTVNNPVPTMSSISPISLAAGSGATGLTVNGTDFVGTSAVRFNGTALTTTSVNSTQLTATIPATLLSAAGTFPVTVFNPAPGGGTSNAINLTVISPAPTGLTAADVPDDQGGAVLFAWTPSASTNVTEQRVYRATTPGGPYALAGTVAAGVSSHTDIGLVNGTTYYYVVRAYNGIIESPNSNEASAVPLDNLPPQVMVTAPSEGFLTNDPTVRVTGTVDDPTATVTVAGQTVPVVSGSWSVALVLAEGSHNLSIVAVDPAGNSSTPVTRQVTVDITGPVLTLASPDDRLLTRNPLLDVTGEANEPVASITVANESATVTGTTFSKSVTLTEGDNLISIIGRDLAGNSTTLLRAVTLDTRPPALTILTPANGLFTNASTVSVIGTVDDPNASVTVNGTPVTVANGQWSRAVTAPEGPLTLVATATDLAGNSATQSVAVTVDRTPPVVVAAAPAQVGAGENVVLSGTADDANGVARLSLAVSAVTLADGTPGASHATRQTGYTIPVTAQIGETQVVTVVATDRAGNQGTATAPMAVTQAATLPGFVEGEVYDDGLGLPLGLANGASATLLGPNGSASPVGDEGIFLLTVSPGPVSVRIEKPGYTAVDRIGAVQAGRKLTLLDARLTPLDRPVTLTSSGGTVTSASGAIQFDLSSGALAGAATLRLTPLTPQGLPFSLPLGWSPLAAVQVDSDASWIGPADLTVKESSDWAVPSATVVVYDASSLRWNVLGSAGIAGPNLNVSLTGPGRYAFVVPDSVSGVIPPSPIVGQPLQGVVPVEFPSGVTAQGRVVPRATSPSTDGPLVAAAEGSVSLTTPVPLPSGTHVTVAVSERFDPRSGETVFTPGYREDIILYAASGTGATGPLAARFPVTPSRRYTVAELLLGTLVLDVRTPEGETPTTLVGPDGATLTGPQGVLLSIPAAAFSAEAPVLVSVLAAPSLPLPTGWQALGTVVADLGQQTLSGSAALTFPLPSGYAPDRQILVAQVLSISGVKRLKLAAVGEVQGSLVTTLTQIGSLVLPGIRQGGEYVFLQPPAPVGFLAGLVRGGGQTSRSGAILEVSGQPFADQTRTDGQYVLIGGIGANVLSAQDPFSGETASTSVSVAARDEVVRQDLILTLLPFSLAGSAPANNATGVSIRSVIELTFNRPVDPTTLGPASVVLRDPQGEVGTFITPTSDPARVLVYPQALVGNTPYTLTLGTDIADLLGRKFPAPVIITFTTANVIPPARPAAGQITTDFPDANGIIAVTGTQGTVDPANLVVLFNRITGETVSVNPNADGSFTARIPGSIGDEIQILIQDADGNQTEFPAPLMRASDGRTYVTPYGGEIKGPDGSRLVIPSQALRVPTVFKLTPVPIDDPNQPLPAPLPEGMVPVGAWQIDSQGISWALEAKFAVPKPATLPSDASALVIRPLTLADGTVRWSIITTAKVIGNEVVTTSPPFPGVLSPGLYASVAFLPQTISQIFYGTVFRDVNGNGTFDGGDLPATGAIVGPGSFSTFATSPPLVAQAQTNGTYALVQGLPDTDSVTPTLTALDPRGTLNRSEVLSPFRPAAASPSHSDILLEDLTLTKEQDTAVPTVKVTPKGPTLFAGQSQVDSPITITLVAEDDKAVASLTLTNNGQSEAINPQGLGTTKATAEFTFTPHETGIITIFGSAQDLKGQTGNQSITLNILSGSGVTPPIPNVPPSVLPTGIFPPNGETDVNVDSEIRIPFSEPVELGPGAVTVEGKTSDGNSLGSVQVDIATQGAEVVLKPKGLLHYDVEYTITIDNPITDAEGKPLSNPTNTAFKTMALTDVGKEPVTGRGLYLDSEQNILTTLEWGWYLSAFDVSDPTAPKRLTPQKPDPGFYSRRTGFSISGGDAVMVRYSQSTSSFGPHWGITLYDVSNPANPTLVRDSIVQESLVPTSVALVGDTVYVGTNVGVKVVDLAQMRACGASSLSCPLYPITVPGTGYVSSIAVVGQTVVAISNRNQLVVLDGSTFGQYLGSLSLPGAFRVSGAPGFQVLNPQTGVEQPRSLALVAGQGILYVVDVTQPDQPTFLSKLEIDGVTSQLTQAVAMPERKMAFTGDSSTSTLYAIDLTNPRDPNEIGTLKAKLIPIYLAINENTVYTTGQRAVAQIGADAGWKLARPIRHGMKRRLGERTAATGWAT